MTQHEAGKGSARRKEDVSKIDENWDRIFGRKSAGSKVRSKTMDDYKCTTEYSEEEEESQDLSENSEERSDEEWTCDVCGGPMYAAAHWTYGQCDDCGARQELESAF